MSAMASLAQQFMLELRTPRSWLVLLVPLFLLLVCYSLSTFSAKRGRPRQQASDNHLPPSPPALPVLGHLHLVGSLPHVSLRNLARKHGYGDLMLLRLGAMPLLVVSSPRAAEAVLRTHDLVFASRPRSLVAEIVLYGPSDIGFTPYGEYWRQARKLVTTHMLIVKRVQSLRLAREEIGEAAAAGAAVDMSDLLGSYINDLACRAVMGKSFRSQGRNKLLRELIEDTSQLLGGFNVEEFFPFLARFGVLSKAVRAKSERVRRRWDELLDSLIEDHERKYVAVAASDSSEDDDDFIHVVLSVRQEYGLTSEQMKAILLDIFFAGIGTASSVLDFTMAELMRRPHLMEKLQAEVNSSVPEGLQLVSEADLTDMTYLSAVIKESLRLHPVVPLLPHFSVASCSIDGHTVPAGLRVLVNSWAIGRDARYWEDAEEFIPERFIGDGGAAHVNFKGSDFQFLPFGSGRRMCAGVNFGIASVELMLANLVHRFDWEVPEGKKRGDIDMSEVFGLVVNRKHKLLLVPKLRV
ncbi:hypothetical protein PVAP13_7NG255800 [Panicum virgatum]|uniref:Uncharacterized protein n=1 Tax=Panicum virgatum TaxID=38727 RepID=A0A8T0Q1M9_PANVG|nr:hypothetical protein PVAP13_7NG255800 [Panicum virgatum]